MSADDERLARVRLSLATEPGQLAVATSVWARGARQTVEDMLSQADVAPDIADRLQQAEPERVLEQAEEQGIKFLIPGDDQWPEQINDLHGIVQDSRGGTPLGLWVRGSVGLRDLVQNAVAIVGSRAATTYGANLAGQLGGELGWDHAVISGAAHGIDQAAHRGALAERGATTVAVLACGVDRYYPEAHRNLLDHIAERGAVVSEVAPGWAPTRWRFLMRNRIIAALAAGTVVVEAATRSGAMNAARWTTLLHRPLMAVPGPVTSAASAGPHQLIQSGTASLVTSGDQVKEVLQ